MEVFHLFNSRLENFLRSGLIWLRKLGVFCLKHERFVGGLIRVMLLVKHLKHRFGYHELLIVPDKESDYSIDRQGKASKLPQEICHTHNAVLSLVSELMLRQSQLKEALLDVVVDTQ